MKVRDVMTVGVISVSPDTALRQVVQLMLGAKISGLPVVSGGKVVGILSESDILSTVAGTGPLTAAQVMTADPITLTEDMSVAEAARRLQRHGIKRAPVVRGDALVGIVTRADLLRPYMRTDSEIRAEVEREVLERALALSPRHVRVWASEGVVGLEGAVPGERERRLIVRLVHAIDGVVDVIDRLAVRPVGGGEAGITRRETG